MLQGVELLIAKEFPPIGARRVVAGLCGLPDARVLVCLRRRLLIRRCARCVWPHVVRTNSAAGEQYSCNRDKPRSVTHRVYSDLESKMPTTVPLTKESDGSTITSSDGRKPERISTFSP